MAFSSDTDLQGILPAIFNHGITDFSVYHANAEDEVIRDIRKEFIPRQHTVALADFDKTKLTESQWTRVNCLRVLGWHALPRLATETTVAGFTDMMEYYQEEYAKELGKVIDDGVYYDTGSGPELIVPIPRAEEQRIWR